MTTHTDHLKDYLRGMRQFEREALVSLLAIDSWTDLAQRELQRRATALLQMLPDDVLKAIARGKLHVPGAIAEVLAEQAE